MFNLFELMQRGQNGEAVEALAKQFGLSQAQAAGAVDAVLPAFMLGFQRLMQQGAGAPGAAEAMAAFGKAVSPDALAQGRAMTAALFGSPDLGRQIAAHAAAASGVSQATLQEMIPAMASMIAGGVARSAAEQGLAWMKTFQPQAPAASKPVAGPANPFDPAGMMDAWSRMMGVAPPEPEPPPPTSSDLGYEAMQKAMQTGREVQEQHWKNLQALFAGWAARTDEKGGAPPKAEGGQDGGG
jgi:hypothetical protein